MDVSWTRSIRWTWTEGTKVPNDLFRFLIHLQASRSITDTKLRLTVVRTIIDALLLWRSTTRNASIQPLDNWLIGIFVIVSHCRSAERSWLRIALILLPLSHSDRPLLSAGNGYVTAASLREPPSRLHQLPVIVRIRLENVDETHLV